MYKLLASLAACVTVAPLLSVGVTAQDAYTVHSFQKQRVTEEYFAEGAGFGDFNRDGKRDLVCGPYWFEGPEFQTRHTIYEGKSFPNDRGYSDNFFSYVSDFNGDGWEDVLKIGLPGTPAFWFQNPGDAPKADRIWNQRLAFGVVDNEAPTFADLTGDGRPELLCTFEGRLGFLQPASSVDSEWQWTSVSDPGSWQKYSHGLGTGDINGDGRNDYLMPEGWWEQPESLDGDWVHHPVRFANGGAEIYAFDVDGDGDNDVVSSQNAHAWGLSWFEQMKSDDGITFEAHQIMGEKPEDNPYGVKFSQLHAIDCDDVDGDGRTDIVAGKCYWAHNGHDPGAREPAVVYWFRNTVVDGRVEFVPHLVDDDSGVGREIHIVDMNGDGVNDIITANKKGTFLFFQETKQVSQAEWQRAQPRRVSSPE